MNLELGKENPPEGEDELIEVLIQSLSRDLDNKGKPAFRQQHPKSHGLVKGEFLVEHNLSEDLKIGVFRQEKHDILVRFSNGSNDRQDGRLPPDTLGDVRGMAIKLLNTGENNTSEQDFITMNHPIMFIKDVRGYVDLGIVRRGIKEGKIVIKPGETPQVSEELKEQFQNISYSFAIVEKMKAKVVTSPLDIIYWSTTPYKLGDRAIKFQIVPQQTQTFNPENAEDKDNYLREAMKQYLRDRDAYFDFKIQLQTNAETMPIEDPTKEWKESESPFIKVATVKIPQQEFDTEAIDKQDESISFSPWHCLPEHQPLGGVNRARKRVYDKLFQKRNAMNT
jgi:catalase